jgi:hypothetical protein
MPGAGELIGDEAPFDGVGCWYRTSGYQPMRNLAQEQALLRSGEIDEAVFVVCAPSARTDLRISLDRLSTTLSNQRLDWLDAEEVLALHHHRDVDPGRRLKSLRPQWDVDALSVHDPEIS